MIEDTIMSKATAVYFKIITMFRECLRNDCKYTRHGVLEIRRSLFPEISRKKWEELIQTPGLFDSHWFTANTRIRKANIEEPMRRQKIFPEKTRGRSVFKFGLLEESRWFQKKKGGAKRRSPITVQIFAAEGGEEQGCYLSWGERLAIS